MPTLVDTDEPLTAGWWLHRLRRSLANKAIVFDTLDAYARGESPLMDLAENVRDAYVKFQARSRTNFAGLVVEAMLNRTTITGFTTGEADDLTDGDAWNMWQANHLDAESHVLHRAAFTMGEASVIVGPPDPDTGWPVITIEDPRQVITVMDPIRRRRTRVAMKTFTDEWTGDEHVYLYLPGFIYRAGLNRRRGEWEWVEEEPQRLPFQQVPVVWMPNRLDIDGRRTLGEFQDATDVLDRITTGVLQRLVIAAMQAFKQRVLKNLPLYDENGEKIDYEGQFAADPAALWMVPQDVDVWESGPTDVTPILNAVRHDVQDLSAITRTPLAWLMPESANQSAEGATFAREGLTSKVADRCRSLSESWEQVIALGFRWMGDDERGDPLAWETLWMPPAEPSLAQRFDAAVKGQQAGVPFRYLMTEVIGMPRAQAEQAEKDKDAADRKAEKAALAAAEAAAATRAQEPAPDETPPAV